MKYEYKSSVDAEYDVGPPYVSPRTPGKEYTKLSSEEKSEQDLLNIIEALTVRIFVERDVWPGWFMEKQGLPAKFEGLPRWLKKAIQESRTEEFPSLPKAAASLVRMDHWTDLCRIIEEDLAAKGYKLKIEYSNVDNDDIEFVERIKCTGDAHYAIAEKFEQCFQSKYWHKVIRPVAKVRKFLGIKAEYKKTLYEVLQSYAHPGHYSDPAGHGTDAGITYAFVISRWDVPDHVKEEIRVGCLAFAHFRTFSLMHVSAENVAGFALGSGE